MDTFEARILRASKEIEVKNNGFIKKFKLPNQYWTHTLTIKAFNSHNFSGKNPESEDSGKILSLVDFEETQQNKEISTFLLPRKDWHISKGDYILPPKSRTKKIFSKNDLHNFLNGFWYIVLTSIICYLILDMLFKSVW